MLFKEFVFNEIHALNCWGGNQQITLGGSTLGISTGCPSNGDTCKVSYQEINFCIVYYFLVLEKLKTALHSFVFVFVRVTLALHKR